MGARPSSEARADCFLVDNRAINDCIQATDGTEVGAGAQTSWSPYEFGV